MDRAEVRDRLSPPPRPGRWRNFRVVEYQLRQHNIYIPQTAAQAEDCPRWMQQGFILYQRLKHLDYRPLEHLPFTKHSLEGRIQRQLVLYKCDLNIPDPMYIFEEITRHRLMQGILPIEDLYQVEELDAMVAAFTAWMAGTQPDQVSMLGDSREGQIVIPTPEILSRYP
jgi:hypothetical protein